MKNPSDRQQGFTLLELMATIAIVAVLGSSLFGLARRASADERRLTTDHRALHDLRSTLDSLERDLRIATTCETGTGRMELTRFDGARIVWSLDGDRLLRDGRALLEPLATFRNERDGQLVRVDLELAPRRSGRSGTRVSTSVRMRAPEASR